LEYKTRPLPQELLEGKKVAMEIGGMIGFDKVALRIPEENVSEEMYDLITEIQDVADEIPNLKEFTVGKACLALFSEDGVWYRARIARTSNIDLGLVDVFYVDYGNSEATATKNIKTMRLDYMQLPQQSWEASLNVTLKENNSDVIDVMQTMNSLNGKIYDVKLVNEIPPTVDLYEHNGQLCYSKHISDGQLKPLYSDDGSQ